MSAQCQHAITTYLCRPHSRPNHILVKQHKVSEKWLPCAPEAYTAMQPSAQSDSQSRLSGLVGRELTLSATQVRHCEYRPSKDRLLRQNWSTLFSSSHRVHFLASLACCACCAPRCSRRLLSSAVAQGLHCTWRPPVLSLPPLPRASAGRYAPLHEP